MLLFTVSAALAVNEGEYLWEGHVITVAEVDTAPTFSPGDMTKDQYPLSVRLIVPEAIGTDENLARALFEQAKLVDANGFAYDPGSSIRNAQTILLLYAVDKTVDADTLSFQFMASNSPIPEAYIGDWAGSAGNIQLSFTIDADGTGTYTFGQRGYYESYDITFSMESSTFSVQIPAANQLGIVACEATHTYLNGILTLDIKTTFADGRSYVYSVPCQKVELTDD
jgi:hypothetical protein